MNAYECKVKFIKDGSINIPQEIKDKLKDNQDIKLIILTEEENEVDDKKINALKELNGLLDDLEDNEKRKFDEIINSRVSFHREGLEL